MSLTGIRKELRRRASAKRAKLLQRFFKTGPGEYAEGDKFIGVYVPDTREIAGKHPGMAEKEILGLLRSPVHEERLLALLCLIAEFAESGKDRQAAIYRLYLKNTRYINNWDLVDLSAPRIVGKFLKGKSKAPLYELARSQDLWERRIAIISTLSFIVDSEFAETLKIAGILLRDREDLIHKATGWMLREVGKRDQAELEGFLQKHAGEMSRTALRYAIEKFPEKKRRSYLSITR